MRKLRNLLKEPIYKDDLKNVLLYGALNMVLFSVLAGALQFFANVYLGIGFSLLLYLIAYMIGKEIKERTYNYHILYSVLSTVFFMVGYIIYYISLYSFVTHSLSGGFQLIFSSGGFMYIVFPYLSFKTYVGANIVYNVLDILIMVFCILTAWNLPKRVR